MTRKYSLLFLIIFLALFFRLYNLNHRYTFEWDQEDDALKVVSMINRRQPLLIGPRVANENSFFVGPYHYYLLTPFYLLTHGDPVAGAYAAVFIGTLTSLVAYFVVKSLFNPQTGFVTACLFAVSPVIISWSAMYASLFSLIILFLCFRIISSSSVKFLSLLYFVLGLSISTHLASASLLIPALFVTFSSSPKPRAKQLLLFFLLFSIPFLPILLFDLRHDFLNSQKILAFVFNQNYGPKSPPLLFLRTFWRSLDFINFPGFSLISRTLSLLIIILGIRSFTQKRQRFLLALWVMSPLLLLFFYHGNISEYYYASATTLIPIFFAKLINQFKNKLVLIPILLFVFLIKLNILIRDKPAVTLQTKKNLVSYLFNQKRDPYFNLSYDLPIGWNNGYSYLFRFYGKEPQNTPAAHLYTIALLSYPPNSGELVYRQSILGIFRR